MVLKFKDTLKSERLILKRTRPTIELAEKMFDLVDKNRKYLEPWLDWSKKTLNVEDSMKYLFDKEEETKKGNKIEYGLFIKKEYIGNISLFNIDIKNKSAEIGYWISFSHARKGYVSEAVRTLEKEAFENLNLNRIVIRCDEENIPSGEVAKKCKYTLESKFREDSFSEYFNSFRNTFIFSKLKSEYKK